MSPSRITESTVEDAALDWTVAHGPDLSACDARACIAPDTLAVERPGAQRSGRSMHILPACACGTHADRCIHVNSHLNAPPWGSETLCTWQSIDE